MKNAILVHSWSLKDEYNDPKYPTSSNSHWFPWLTKQLMMSDIHTVSVEMPKPYYPIYDDWKKEFERYDITEQTLLVGHSCGGGFLIRWLSENTDKKVAKVVLVAPWVGVDPEQPFDKKFFEFSWDKNLATRIQELVLFKSSNDVESVQKSIDMILAKLGKVKFIELQNKGHFTLKGLGTEEFPELLEEILR